MKALFSNNRTKRIENAVVELTKEEMSKIQGGEGTIQAIKDANGQLIIVVRR